MIDDLLGENRRGLERILDLYISGDVQKELLIDRKARLESTIKALEKERASLAAHLEATTLTAEQVHDLEDFASRVAAGLVLVEDDFDTKRNVIEALDVQATLVVENEEQVIYARCMLGEEVLRVVSNSIEEGRKQE